MSVTLLRAQPSARVAALLEAQASAESQAPMPTPLSTNTPNYGWQLPDVGGSTNVWGAELNATLTSIDATCVTMLPLAGGTLTGPLTLAADPTTALGAATKQYTDNAVSTAGGHFLPLTGGTLTGPVTFSSTTASTFAASPTGPTPTAGDNSTKLATTGFVGAALSTALGGYLPLTGGTLTGAVYQEHASADALGGWWVNQKARGAIGSEAVVQYGDSLGNFAWLGHNGSGFATAAYLGASVVEGTPSPTAFGTGISLFTTSAGSSAPTRYGWWNRGDLFSYMPPPIAIGAFINGAYLGWTVTDNFTAPKGLIGLEVQGTSVIMRARSWSSGGSTIWLEGARGDGSASTASLSGDLAGNLTGRLLDSSGNFQAIGQISFTLIDPAPSPTSLRSQMNFRVNPTGSNNSIQALTLNDINATLAAGINLSLSGTGTGNANVGIQSNVSGTANGLFQILATGGTSQANINLQSDGTISQIGSRRYSNDGAASNLIQYKARGTQAAPAVVATNDQLGVYYWYGYNGSGFTQCALMRGVCIDTTPSSSAMGAQILLAVCPIGSTTLRTIATFDFTNGSKVGTNLLMVSPAYGSQTGNATLQLAAGTSGNAQIQMVKSASGQTNVIYGFMATTATSGSRWAMALGDTSAESGSNAGSNFSIAAYSDTGTLLGNIMSALRSSQVVTFPQTIVNGSDARWKENVAPITHALDLVRKLKGVFYNRKHEERRQAGMIAQDVREALPEAVQDTGTMTLHGEEYEHALGISYTDIIAVLVEAVKELGAKVAALEEAHA